MQRFNLTPEQLYPYNKVINIQQATCSQIDEKPAQSMLMKPHTSTNLAFTQHIGLQSTVIISSEDELASNISCNLENDFIGFNSSTISVSTKASNNHMKFRRRKFRHFAEDTVNHIRVEQQKQLQLQLITPVKKTTNNNVTATPSPQKFAPQELIFEINSNSTTSSQQKQREERNKWLKQQLHKQQQLRELQTAKIREFRELLNQRSNTNISTDSTISEFPASSPSNPHILTNNKYAPRVPLLKNTLPADAFERTLAIISAANTQITYNDKVNSWQCADDVSEVEDVRDFEIRFIKTELSREQQRKARKRRHTNKQNDEISSPLYTLDEFCEMLRRLCNKKYSTTPFTAIEHLHRQSRLHKTVYENHKYVYNERLESSESTVEDEQLCNRRNKRKPSATQRRTKRLSSPTPCKEDNAEVISSQSNQLHTITPTKATTIAKQNDICSAIAEAIKANECVLSLANKEKWHLNAEEKSLFRFYKQNFDEQQQAQHQQKQHLQQPNDFKTPILPIKYQPNATEQIPSTIISNEANLNETSLQTANIVDMPCKLLATTTPSQSDSSDLASTPNPITINNNSNNHVPTSSNESRRSLPEFGVIHQQHEFCSYLGLTGMSLANNVATNRSNSALTRRSLRVRMQQQHHHHQHPLQPYTTNSQSKSKAHSNQQSLDGSNLYMTPANSQPSPFQSSEQQSDVLQQYLQPHSKRHERQSLDYSNYTSESPKNSQTPEEYRDQTIDNYPQQFKRAYTSDDIRLIPNGREEFPLTDITLQRISPGIEPCTSTLNTFNKSTPIVQYKPNTKPEIKIICSIAATTKDEVLWETKDCLQEQPIKQVQQHQTFAQVANENNEAIKQQTDETLILTPTTTTTTASSATTNAKEHIAKALQEQQVNSSKSIKEYVVENTKTQFTDNVEPTVNIMQRNELFKLDGKLTKMTPQDAYKRFQTYLMESRKSKPSICIVQTLPGAKPASELTNSTYSTSPPKTLSDRSAAPEATATSTNHNTNLNLDRKDNLKNTAKLTDQNKNTIRRKKLNKSSSYAQIGKLVTRSSRRILRHHKNKNKITIITTTTKKHKHKRKIRPKPKAQEPRKESNIEANTPSNINVGSDEQLFECETNDAPSTISRQTFLKIVEKNMQVDHNDDDETGYSDKYANPELCGQFYSNLKDHALHHKNASSTLQRFAVNNDDITKHKEAETTKTKITKSTTQQKNKSKPDLNWLKRRRKSYRSSTAEGSIPTKTTTNNATTTIETNCNNDNSTQSFNSPNNFIIEKSDYQMQTSPIQTKDQYTQSIPHVDGIHYITKPTVVLENPLNELDGDVIYMYYELDILIVVQQKMLSFWKYSKVTNLLASPDMNQLPNIKRDNPADGMSMTLHDVQRNEWFMLGKVKRLLIDVEIQSSYANRICVNNSMPLYLELRCRELPHGYRECKLLTMFVNVYYYHDEEMVCKVHSIPLDSVQGESNKVLFTTLIDSRYFIMSWSHENSAGKVITGFCKYSLTPHLDTLASIRGFKNLFYELTYLECINEDKLIGFGVTQVTIWDHRSGDVLMNYDLNIPLGINMGCTYYPSFDIDNMIVLYQYKYTDNHNCELIVIALDISATTPAHRILHRHTLPNTLLNKIKNTINNGEQLIITSQNEQEIWLSCADPTAITFVPAQKSNRYYTRGRNQIIELTANTLTVSAFTDYLLKLTNENN